MSYIEREALLEHKRKMKGFDLSIEYWSEAVLCEDIRNAPTADVVEVRHGEWLERSYGELQCSACGIVQEDEPHRYNYCPCCGAKMDGGRSDNDNN